MIESILSLFAVGTLGFWLLMFFASVVFIAATENDHYTLPTIVLIGLGIAYWKPIMNFDWRAIALFIAGFAIIGTLWSAFRWHKYVKKTVKKYTQLYGNTLSESKMRELKREIDVTENKSRIVAWIAWWPWSMLWHITGDFFTMIYDGLKSVYQRIADNAMSNLIVKEPDKKKEVITDADRFDSAYGRNCSRDK